MRNIFKIITYERTLYVPFASAVVVKEDKKFYVLIGEAKYYIEAEDFNDYISYFNIIDIR